MHEVKSQLTSEVHSLAKSLMELHHLVVMLALLPTVHQARGSGLEELETCKFTLVVDCITPVFWVLENFLNDVWHSLGSIAGLQILQLPSLVSNGQEQDLCSRFGIIYGRLHYVA